MSNAPQDASALTKRMVREYERGSTLTALSVKHNMSLQAVRQTLVEAGATIRRKGGMLPTDQGRVDTMKQLYLEEGLTLQEIGNKYGLTRQRVQQILRSAGVESLGRRPDDSLPVSRKLNKEEREIAALYEKGVRPAEIMEQHDITYSALQTILRRGNIATKPKGFFNRRPDYERVRNGVLADYEKGVDTGEIADKYGLCGRTEIYKFLKREGAPVRHGSNEEAAHA